MCVSNVRHVIVKTIVHVMLFIRRLTQAFLHRSFQFFWSWTAFRTSLSMNTIFRCFFKYITGSYLSNRAWTNYRSTSIIINLLSLVLKIGYRTINKLFYLMLSKYFKQNKHKKLWRIHADDEIRTYIFYPSWPLSKLELFSKLVNLMHISMFMYINKSGELGNLAKPHISVYCRSIFASTFLSLIFDIFSMQPLYKHLVMLYGMYEVIFRTVHNLSQGATDRKTKHNWWLFAFRN